MSETTGIDWLKEKAFMEACFALETGRGGYSELAEVAVQTYLSRHASGVAEGIDEGVDRAVNKWLADPGLLREVLKQDIKALVRSLVGEPTPTFTPERVDDLYNGVSELHEERNWFREFYKAIKQELEGKNEQQ